MLLGNKPIPRLFSTQYNDISVTQHGSDCIADALEMPLVGGCGCGWVCVRGWVGVLSPQLHIIHLV